MRIYVGLTAMALMLGACVTTPPSDQYFDKINPTPQELELKAAQDRLAAAERGNVVFGTDGEIVSTSQPQPLTPQNLPDGTPNDAVVADQTPVAPEAPATPVAVAPVDPDNPEISNTQDFSVASAQDTIESDAARLEALKQDYRIVEATAVPTRKGAGVNLASYALSQKQAIGEKTYRRRNTQSQCGKYRNNADEAQRVFLSAGGPDRDRRGLDNDGDGFACDWNPDQYRALLQ
jgi:hypothetical protein